ncbi:acyl carrier protein [Serratia rhizosphaerae]|uniref:Acyl carrier protein n=1 Tax=Serratia rhizosphaerae TaxID=2597702 RepID=A0ABX6GPK3_9GAMM|nr:acyl carrier protein [Serratia rhizosphaerae]MEB6336728.1 acyl carrier protein [Serratia rhizosphaerae]QHA88218.1 acyl carrier protein [Serratia rhizosphaerae]
MEKYQQVYDTLCEMICDAKDLDASQLSPDMPLLQLKLDSLDYVEMMVLAKREFGATLSAEMFIEHPEMTLGELCHTLAEQKK